MKLHIAAFCFSTDQTSAVGLLKLVVSEALLFSSSSLEQTPKSFLECKILGKIDIVLGQINMESDQVL